MPEQPVHGRLTVDLAGLREISADLRRDTDADLRPGFATAQRQIDWGVRFCFALDCAEGRAARASVAEVLQQHKVNAQEQLRIAEGLAIALERIVENYRDADARAAARITEVEAELNRAVTQLQTPSPKAAHTPWAQQRGGMLK
jgi:hypothetical protein